MIDFVAFWEIVERFAVHELNVEADRRDVNMIRERHALWRLRKWWKQQGRPVQGSA